VREKRADNLQGKRRNKTVWQKEKKPFFRIVRGVVAGEEKPPHSCKREGGEERGCMSGRLMVSRREGVGRGGW